MSTRYFRRGTTKIYFVALADDITSLSGPHIAEITAGTDITCDVAELAGFAFQNNPIPTPDMCSPFVSKIPGEDTADDSTMTFYDLLDAVGTGDLTVWDLLAKGEAGYIVFFPYGVSGTNAPLAGDDCEVWPVTVAKTTRQYSAGNDPARYETTFTITAPPAQNAVVVS